MVELPAVGIRPLAGVPFSLPSTHVQSGNRSVAGSNPARPTIFDLVIGGFLALKLPWLQIRFLKDVSFSVFLGVLESCFS